MGRKLSEKLQELLLKYILEEKNEFVIQCKELERVKKLFLALGRNIIVKEKKNEEECVIMVYSHAF